MNDAQEIDINNLQQQQPIGNNINIPDTYDEDIEDFEPDNSRWELDYDEVLTQFEHSLKSEVKNLKNGKWERPQNIKPKVNDSGAFDILSDLRMVLHKGTPLGSIDADYSIMETKALAKAFTKKLVLNTKNWEIDKSQRATLVLQYASMIYMILTRSVNDMERKHRKGKYKVNEQFNNKQMDMREIRL